MSLLVGTSAGLYAVGGSTEEVIGGTRINHIVRDGDNWWAADGTHRLHQNGSVVATMPDDVVALCLQNVVDGVWIGTNQARLFKLEGDELSEDRAFAHAPGRERWHTPWGAPADTRSMTVDAGRTLYVNVHVGGVLRYDAGGPTPTLDISADVHQVAAHPSRSEHIFAACASGLAISRDGRDFQIVKQGLHGPYSRAVAVMENQLLLSASTGPRSTDARLYFGSLDGDFSPVGRGLPESFAANIDTHTVIAGGSTAHVGFGDKVWRSEDGGNSWAILTTGLPQITCLA